jgi:YVTN family beta-propeller protein
MRMRNKLAYAALATTLVACFEDVELEDDKEEGTAPDAQVMAPVEVDGTVVVPDAGAPVYDAGQRPVMKVLAQASRGAPVALTSDESVAVVVNRDVGSASVLRVKYEEGKPVTTEQICELSFGAGSEPWQVVIGPDDQTAYVVLRRDQKLVRIRQLTTKPTIEGSVAVGSEPTSVALSPSGYTAYVANWSDGTVAVIDTEQLAYKSTIDLNEPLVKTGYLGKVTPRAALAHPRSLTVTNDLDLEDGDETLLVTEYFAQQVAELNADGLNADVNKAGIVYRVRLQDHYVSTVTLSALENIGFSDTTAAPAGCYPNQLQSVTVNGNFAYVMSVCAAPEGPEGIKVTAKECQSVADCSGDDLKLVAPVCDVVAFGKAKVCQDVANFKTATSPAISVIDIAQGREVQGAAVNLNASFDKFFNEKQVPKAGRKFPLFGQDVAFVPGTNVGYVVANGIDGVFRVVYDGKSGKLTEVGSPTSPFINLFPAGKGPIGIAIGSANKKFALVANNITRNVTAVDFNTQALAGGAASPSATLTAALPPKGSDEESILIGKDLFNTGRARWSLDGEGWGACQSCHSDGLTDNVTWFFGRGPRQSTSLDGSYASKNALDQRIFNHTSNRDEVADFELNTRNTSGGVGAIVLAKSTPPVNLDRLDTPALKQAELDGSSLAASDPANPLKLGFDATGKVVVGQLLIDPYAKSAAGQLDDWKNITRYMQTIRSPRGPANLDRKKVEEGKHLFSQYGSCQGCHGGDKWTISKRFYDPTDATMAALKVTPFAVPTGFPTAILPAQAAQDQKLVINAGGESVQCVMRNVGTFNVAESGVGIAELRQDMKTLAQGGGVALRPNEDGDNNAANDPKAGIGYNVPSLLGLASGAPYLHAGNVRTLEALLTEQFKSHNRALAPNFLLESDPAAVQRQVDALVQYLLSIEEDSETFAIPAAGASGGLLCPENFAATSPTM